MTRIVHELRDFLEARDVEGFLTAYEGLLQTGERPPEITGLTQRVLPPILLQTLTQSLPGPATILRLWHLVRSHRLLLVDNEVLDALNQHLPRAWAATHGADAGPPPLLPLFKDDISAVWDTSPPAVPVASIPNEEGPAIPFRRIVLSSTFVLGPVHISDMMSFKKNLCPELAQREFLKAIRHYFPHFLAYPRVPLRQFMNLELLGTQLSTDLRHYARAGTVDILLCTEDEDPLAGFELDSSCQDREVAKERDELKNRLFRLANIPLIRIRALDAEHVRAEDFYDLLLAESETLDRVRPRRLRPRRDHDGLIPAEMSYRRLAS